MADRTQRTRGIAQTLLVVAAAGLWVASRLPWVRIRSFDGLGAPATTTLIGATWSAALLPLAVVLVATAVAAVAVRGWALRILAGLTALISAAAGYLAIGQWAAGDVAARAAELSHIAVESLTSGTERYYLGAGITLAAAAGTLVAAALLMRSAGANTGRYTTPAARRALAQDTVVDDAAGPGMSERMIWDALDEGRDPTAEGR